MNLSKFLKGSNTIGELQNLPCSFLQTIYKEFVDSAKDPNAQKAMAGEQMQDMLEEAMGG